MTVTRTPRKLTSEVVKALDGAFPEQQVSREKMWGAYHCIRTSPSFACLWREFLQQAKIQALPIFYQSQTDSLFQKRIEVYFPISCSSQQVSEEEAEGTVLTFEEENAICYAAGYVLRAVRKKISKSSKQQKEQLVEAIDGLQSNDDVEDNGLSSSWMAVVHAQRWPPSHH